jgi:tetratricopeptide (TPR) repeat protein
MWFGNQEKRKQRRQQRELTAAIDRGRQFQREDCDGENLQFFKEKMEQFPDSGELRLLYGTALLLSQPKQGLSEIARATEIDPEDPILLTRAAHIMYCMKQLDHARSYAKRAKELAPESEFIFASELLNLESNFAALDGDDERAEEGLRLAVKREPKMESLAVDLARFLADRGRHKEALSLIDEAMKRTKGTMYLKRLRAEIVDDSGSEFAASPIR